MSDFQKVKQTLEELNMLYDVEWTWDSYSDGYEIIIGVNCLQFDEQGNYICTELL